MPKHDTNRRAVVTGGLAAGTAIAATAVATRMAVGAPAHADDAKWRDLGERINAQLDVQQAAHARMKAADPDRDTALWQASCLEGHRLQAICREALLQPATTLAGFAVQAVAAALAEDYGEHEHDLLTARLATAGGLGHIVDLAEAEQAYAKYAAKTAAIEAEWEAEFEHGRA